MMVPVVVGMFRICFLKIRHQAKNLLPILHIVKQIDIFSVDTLVANNGTVLSGINTSLWLPSNHINIEFN